MKKRMWIYHIRFFEGVDTLSKGSRCAGLPFEMLTLHRLG